MITSANQITRYLAVIQEDPGEYRSDQSGNGYQNPQKHGKSQIYHCPQCKRRRTFTADQIKLIAELLSGNAQKFRPECAICKVPMKKVG